MNENIKYIKANCIEWKELCAEANISSAKLSQLIAEQILPSPSYVIDIETTIKSSLNDSYTIHDSEKYFSKNLLTLIEAYKDETDVSNVKQAFRKRMLEALKNANDKQFAYGNILDQSNEIDLERFEKAFEEEWSYFCQGVYGICTINASEEEIVKKEIAVKKLIDFNQKFNCEPLNDAYKETLKQLSLEFDAVTSLFAPYQRETSSRGKYLDKIAQQNAMHDLVKDYSK